MQHDRGAVLRRDAIEVAVGLAAGEQRAGVVEGQAGDVRLPGFIPDDALAGSRDAPDASVVARRSEQSAIGGDGQRPDVFGLGVEPLLGFARGIDAPDLAAGRSGRKHCACWGGRERENFGLLRGPEGLRFRRGGRAGREAIEATAMAGSKPECAVGGTDDGPDGALAGRRESIEARGECQAAVAG